MPRRWLWRLASPAGLGLTATVLVALAAGAAPAATVLERRVEVTLRSDGSLRESTALRVRMDAVQDLEDWASYPVFLDDNRELVEVAGRVVHPDGRSEKIRRRHRDEISLSGGSVFHDSARALFLQLPGLAVGSTAEIETVVDSTPYFPAGAVSLLGDEPVESLSVTVRGAPPGWRWRIEGPDDGLTAREDAAGVTVTGRRLEPRTAADDGPGGTALYPLLRYAWGDDTSWAGVGKWYRKLVAELPLGTAAVRQRAAELLGEGGRAATGGAAERSAAARRAVLETLARAVQADVRYVAVEVGIGGYRPSPPAEVLDRRWGDCKDKALLLIDLLATAGITAHPVLVLSADDRRIDPEFPSPTQFNHLIVAVPGDQVETAAGDAVAGGYLFVDATQPRGGAGWLQPGVQGQRGLVVLPGGGELVRLPVLPDEERITLVANLRIDPEGQAAGGAALAVTGMSALRLLDRTASGSPSRTEDTVRGLLLAVLPGAELGQVAWNAKEGDLPALEVAAGLRLPHLMQGSGDRAWLSLPSLRAAPEPRRLDDRELPLVTDAVTVSLTWHLTLPPGCTPPEARSDEVVNRAGSFRQVIQPEDGGRFTISRRVVLGERWYESGELEELAAIAVAEHQALRRRLRFGCSQDGEAAAPEAERPSGSAATPSDPPAPPGSTSPAVAAEGPTTVVKEHEILMTWLEPGESGDRLVFARLTAQGWSEPITVAEPVSTLDPSDRPSLIVIDTQAVRRTLIARTGDVIARSGDGGRTWTRLPSPALPFASFAGGDEGAYAFWLAGDGNGGTRLLGTRVMAGETLLDERVTGGSATAAAMTWDGPVVVYRDRGAEDTRDVVMVRRQDALWTPPRPVHVEGWRPERMPQSGPQVAADRRRVAVAWHTEAAPNPRVLVAFSSDAGRTFGAPLEVDAGEGDRSPRGPVAVALDGDGHALVLWTASRGATAATLNLARVSAGAQRGEELVLARQPPAHLGDAPQMARAGDRVAVAWTEGVPERVRAVAVPLAAVPALGSRRPDPAAASAGSSRPHPGQGRVGEPAPDAKLVSLDGEKVSLSSLRGRPVLLNLWATWCVPCREEMPELAALSERYRREGLVVVGVSVDSAEARDQVREFVGEEKIPFAVWLDPEMRFPDALRVRGFPATFVLDREGRIVWRRDRAITADDPELEQALDRALSD